MQTTLEKVFWGKILPNEKVDIKVEGSKETYDEMNLTYNYFKRRLTKEQNEDMDYFMGLTNEVSDMRATQSFIDGFKMGARIIMETFINEEN